MAVSVDEMAKCDITVISLSSSTNSLAIVFHANVLMSLPRNCDHSWPHRLWSDASAAWLHALLIGLCIAGGAVLAVLRSLSFWHSFSGTDCVMCYVAEQVCNIP